MNTVTILPLALTNFLPDSDEIQCKICGEGIHTNYSAYGCSECNNYFTHLKCAQRQRTDPNASTRNDIAAGNEIIQHFRHPHSLIKFFPHEKIINGEDRVCDGCMKCLSVSGPSYKCEKCNFFLHEECTKLPTTTKTHPLLHPPHSLTLISIPDFVFQCEACLQHFHGFAYHCKTCFSTFDVRCASIKSSLQHPNHQHPVYLYEMDDRNRIACEACGKKVKDKLVFQCTKCEYYLDIRCATLPVIVRYRFDQHPLNLTFVEEERRDEYYCDICEEEREMGLWFYSCRKCSFAAHPRCAVGEFPYVKSTMHKAHRHPLNLVMKLKGKEEGGGCTSCGACKKSCAENLAFECGACKFNVHATGRCYHSQVLQGNLAFTNHNVFSRANQPYDYEQEQSFQK